MVTIETRNCRGLADKKKRLDIFNKIRMERIHVVCLQDVHLEKREKNKLKQEWGGTVLLSAKSSMARGVAILFYKNLDFKIHNSACDNEGNYILVDITIEVLPGFTLANIYAPNKDTPSFFKEIWARVEQMGKPATVALVHELTFETLPPPWGISETYFSKNLIPSPVQISLSALISRVRLPWRAN